MATFNVDASELLDEQSKIIASLQKENMILRFQLKDAERQLDEQDGVKGSPDDKPRRRTATHIERVGG